MHGRKGSCMNKTIKAIFFDVDGTMYWHPIHDLVPSTKETLQKLHKKGYKIGVATSRCHAEFDHVPSFLREFPFDGMIFDGGALILDRDGSILYQNDIKEEDKQVLIGYAQAHGLTVRYATADGNYFLREETPQIQDEFFKLYLTIPTVKSYEGDICDNILICANEQQQKEIIDQLSDVNISDHKELLEITAKGTNKASAVERLAAMWGIGMDEVLCFGDGFNDLEMIEQAGIGVAMGNGENDLKRLADYVCDPIDRDGIANIVKELGLL
jgi:Cof subfamily protein (haloacid dehalogenase superfamily)